MVPPRETSHTVRNVRVRLFTAGDGPPMAPEHPGFGASDNPAFIRNVSDVAMYYLDFLDGLAATSGSEKVHLAGNSLGGWIGAESLFNQYLAMP